MCIAEKVWKKQGRKSLRVGLGLVSHANTEWSWLLLFESAVLIPNILWALALLLWPFYGEGRVVCMWRGKCSPSVATSLMGTLCFCAMYPRKEKTTKPEEKLVRELMEVVMIASL